MDTTPNLGNNEHEEKNKNDDKQLKREVTKVIDPDYFTKRVLKSGYRINLDIHYVHHTIPKLTNKAKHIETEKSQVNNMKI